MTGSRQADSIASLGNLKACPLAVRAEPDGGYLAYLDFSDVFEPDGRQVEETFRNLARKEPSDKLTCPGWIGFFGYEFLAAHLGLDSGERDRPTGSVFAKQGALRAAENFDLLNIKDLNKL